jgi:hypothetical protein
MIYAIPNGGHRNKITAAKLKAEGVLKGMPDLCVPVARNGYNALYIEMKAGKNKPTKNQRIAIDYLMKEGSKCEICYSFEQFRNIVNEYLNEHA